MARIDLLAAYPGLPRHLGGDHGHGRSFDDPSELERRHEDVTRQGPTIADHLRRPRLPVRRPP